MLWFLGSFENKYWGVKIIFSVNSGLHNMSSKVKNCYKNIISKVHLFLKQCCTILGWLNFMFLFNITSTDFRLTSADVILKRTIILIQLTLRCQINESTWLAFLDFCPTLTHLFGLARSNFPPYSISKFSTLFVYLVLLFIKFMYVLKISTLLVYLALLV